MARTGGEHQEPTKPQHPSTLPQQHLYYHNELGFRDHDDVPFPLPLSKDYEIRHSSTSGRGVFAKTDLEIGTVLLRTDCATATGIRNTAVAGIGDVIPSRRDTQAQTGPEVRTLDTHDDSTSPLAYTILREYRKEVCAECFDYDRGRDWKVKFDYPFLWTWPQSQNSIQSPSFEELFGNYDLSSAKKSINAGIVFCSETCRTQWIGRYGLLGVYAFMELENAVRRTIKMKGAKDRTYQKPEAAASPEQSEESSPPSASLQSPGANDTKTANTALNTPHFTTPRRPTIEEIRAAWKETDITVEKIQQARAKPVSHRSKMERKTLKQASEPEELDCDVCYYLLTAVLNTFAAERMEQGMGEDIDLDAQTAQIYLSDENCRVAHKDSTLHDADQNHYLRYGESTENNLIVTDEIDINSSRLSSNNRPPNRDRNHKHNYDQKKDHHQCLQPKKKLKKLYPMLLALTPDPECYAHPSSTLKTYTTSYIFLHAVLPLPLLFAGADFDPVSVSSDIGPQPVSLSLQRGEYQGQKRDQDQRIDHDEKQQQQLRAEYQDREQQQPQQQISTLHKTRLSSTLAHELNSRASHNAFSIRPSASTDGDQSGEFLGWGVWPVASLFNHSCARNVHKIRNGRHWIFVVESSASAKTTAGSIMKGRISDTDTLSAIATTNDKDKVEIDDDGQTIRNRSHANNNNGTDENTQIDNSNHADNYTSTDVGADTATCPNVDAIVANADADAIVQVGQELCITYLGGDEWDLDVVQRRKRLQDAWGFWCMCVRCVSEDNTSSTSGAGTETDAAT